MLRHFFYGDPERMIYRYPRYGELFDAWQAQRNGADGNAGPVRRAGFPRSADVVAAGLVRRGVSGPRSEVANGCWSPKARTFTLEDQARMGASSARSWPRWLPEYSKLAASGRSRSPPRPTITPFCRCCAIQRHRERSHPGVPCRRASRYPEDARKQLEMAREYVRSRLSAWRRWGCGRRKARSPTRLRPSPPSGLRVGRHRQRRSQPHAGPRPPRRMDCTGLTAGSRAGGRWG
jgi:hypothetical protein